MVGMGEIDASTDCFCKLFMSCNSLPLSTVIALLKQDGILENTLYVSRTIESAVVCSSEKASRYLVDWSTKVAMSPPLC